MSLLHLISILGTYKRNRPIMNQEKKSKEDGTNQQSNVMTFLALVLDTPKRMRKNLLMTMKTTLTTGHKKDKEKLLAWDSPL